ncbi:MAG: GNAT family N-acetyltransferase [Patescibacteria group bacterium]|jgi:GNAT superfamily N-acetyltransferase
MGFPGVIKTHIVGDGIEGFDRVHEMTELTSNAFGVMMDEPDVARHLLGHLVVDVAVENRSIGFASAKYFRTQAGNVLYISGMAIHKDFQGQRIGPLLVSEMYDYYQQAGKDVAYIAGRTSNPRVARSRRVYCEGNGTYPIDRAPDDKVVVVAQHIRQALGMVGAFDPSTLVCKDVYRQPLYIERPSSGDQKIDTFFLRNVGTRDAVFIIGIPDFSSS